MHFLQSLNICHIGIVKWIAIMKVSDDLDINIKHSTIQLLSPLVVDNLLHTILATLHLTLHIWLSFSTYRWMVYFSMSDRSITIDWNYAIVYMLDCGNCNQFEMHPRHECLISDQNIRCGKDSWHIWTWYIMYSGHSRRISWSICIYDHCFNVWSPNNSFSYFWHAHSCQHYKLAECVSATNVLISDRYIRFGGE